LFGIVLANRPSKTQKTKVKRWPLTRMDASVEGVLAYRLYIIYLLKEFYIYATFSCLSSFLFFLKKERKKVFI
jgi:hypothetical protein